MKIIWFLLLHIFSSISSFPQFKEIHFEDKCLRGSAPLIIRKNQSLNGEIALPVWGPEYEVKFDLKVNSWSGDWGSIFRFSALPGNCEISCKIGERAPAMWTTIGTRDKLLIVTNIDSNGNRGFSNELGRFQKGTWYSFVISQKKESVVKIKIKQHDFSHPLRF